MPADTTFDIEARDGTARAGLIHTAHGDIPTPAFVPLATSGTVKGLASAEVAELGFPMVLGNTFHLFITPGEDHVAEMGGLHEFMAWRRPIITDSGGFQVFSMGYGSVADEIKRSRGKGESRILKIDEEGVRFTSYMDGSEKFMGPETSMEIQAKLGSDIALAFDECTPFHVDRDYTARSTERTHRWLERCVEWRAQHAPDSQLFYGIVQGGTYDDLRDESAQRAVSTPGLDGIAVGGSLGQDKEQMMSVVERSLRPVPDEWPRHLLGIGDVDDILAAVRLGIDTFDCATPTRLGRHGTALIPDPEHRWRVELRKGRWLGSKEPIVDGCPCVACRDHTRGYLHYLIREKELTSARLVTLHNLTFMSLLMNGIRGAIATGDFEDYAARVMSGEEPYGSATASGPG
ncbi:MAG: queuine tRNA-ribosyltransferase [Thermoleophilales bacterium]|nr:queuine tRNA-ribosyltransferase [Thermoleophilales bacterium]